MGVSARIILSARPKIEHKNFQQVVASEWWEPEEREEYLHWLEREHQIPAEAVRSMTLNLENDTIDYVWSWWEITLNAR